MLGTRRFPSPCSCSSLAPGPKDPLSAAASQTPAASSELIKDANENCLALVWPLHPSHHFSIPLPCRHLPLASLPITYSPCSHPASPAHKYLHPPLQGQTGALTRQGCSHQTKGRAIKPHSAHLPARGSLWAAMSVCMATAKPGAEALSTACSLLLESNPQGGISRQHRSGTQTPTRVHTAAPTRAPA